MDGGLSEGEGSNYLTDKAKVLTTLCGGKPNNPINHPRASMSERQESNTEYVIVAEELPQKFFKTKSYFFI